MQSAYFWSRRENEIWSDNAEVLSSILSSPTEKALADGHLIEQLAHDEAIAAADTLLLTIPNQLGVDYCAHVLGSVLGDVAPDDHAWPHLTSPNAGAVTLNDPLPGRVCAAVLAKPERARAVKVDVPLLARDRMAGESACY